MSSAKHFNAETTALEVIEGVDLSGKDVIVTGGNSGIGVETVRVLAKAGARIVLTGRDVKKGEEVAEKIRKEFPKSVIEVEQLDLASLANVREFVNKFLAKKRPLHILINNAGIISKSLTYTEDGFETEFGVNHIGHFALTTGLLPSLKEAKNARVVIVSSLVHVVTDVDFDDLEFKKRPYHPLLAYAQSKTANMLMAVEFNKRYAHEGITANSLHPGVIETGLGRDFTDEENKARKLGPDGKPLYIPKSIEQGAATQVWAAVAPELEGKGGLYLENCSIGKPLSEDKIEKLAQGGLQKAGIEDGYLTRALDPVRAEKLWILSEKLIEKKD